MRRDVLLTVGTRVLITVAGLAAGIVTARFLGERGRGEYFFGVTVAAGIVQFANLGLHASNTYQVASERSLLRGLTANSLWVSIVLGGGGGVAVAAVLQLTGAFPDLPDRTFWLAAAIAPASLFFLLGANLLVGVQRIGEFNAVEAGSRVFLLLALLGAGLAAWGASGFLAVSAVAWTIVAVVLLGLILREGDRRLTFDRAVFAAGYRYAARSYAIAVFGYLVLRGNVFLLEHSKGSNEVGEFSIATQAADAIAIVPTSMALVLFPALVRDRAGSWARTVRATAVTSATLTAVCVFFALFARPLIRIVFGAQYLPAAPMLRLLLPGIVCVGATAVLGQYLGALGQPRAFVALWAGAVALALGLGALLIPDHGGQGAAIALSVTYGAVLAGVLMLGLRHSAAERRAASVP